MQSGSLSIRGRQTKASSVDLAPPCSSQEGPTECVGEPLYPFSLSPRFSLFCIATINIFRPTSPRQQTLGGITSIVIDITGGALGFTTVTIVNDQTNSHPHHANQRRRRLPDSVNLPIGSYTLTYTHTGFQTQKIPSITVQGRPHRHRERAPQNR